MGREEHLNTLYERWLLVCHKRVLDMSSGVFVPEHARISRVSSDSAFTATCGSWYQTRIVFACPLNNDLRTDMVTKLRVRISFGLQLTLALPAENPDLWTQVLLQGHPEDLGVDLQMSLRALSAAAHADVGEGAPLSLVRQFVDETKQQLQIVALDDRSALSSVDQRFACNVVRRSLALQDSVARPRRRSRRAAVARPRKPRGADGLRL